VATNAIILQIELLQIQIELQESNYKYAVQLQKDHETLRRMRTNIRELKDTLESLQKKYLASESAS
jgi:hypothetical protein